MSALFLPSCMLSAVTLPASQPSIASTPVPPSLHPFHSMYSLMTNNSTRTSGEIAPEHWTDRKIRAGQEDRKKERCFREY